MQNKFSTDRISYLALFITIILVPIFFIPSTSVTVEAAKNILLVAGVIISFSLFLIQSVKRGEFEFPAHKIMWSALLIPGAFFLSAILSNNPHMGLFGYSLEVGTWGFITLGFVLMFLSAVLIRTKEEILYIYTALLGVFGLIALLALGKFFLGSSALTLRALTVNTPSPLGSWNDVGVFFGGASLLILLALEELKVEGKGKISLIISFIVSLFIVAVVNVAVVWSVLLVFALIYLLFTFSFRNEGQTSERRLSYGALALLIVSLLFFFNPVITSGGARLGDALSTRFGVDNAVVRPSLQATYQVAQPALKENPIFGSGPNTFDTSWLKFKPTGVNETIFWNVPFLYGVGFLPTLMVTTGALGSILLIVFLALYILLGVKALFVKTGDRGAHFLAGSSFVFSLFLWVMMFVYIPSKAVLALAFIFTGLFFAAAKDLGIIEKKIISYRNNSKLAFVAVLLLIGVLVGNVAYAYSAVRQSSASIYFQHAVVSAGQKKLDEARTYTIKAANLSGEDIYYGALSQLSVAKANEILSSASSTQANRDAFQVALAESISAAQAAVKARPESYTNWVSLGTLYESLVPAPLAVEGAYTNAKSSYEEAIKRNPTSPEPYYLLARLEVANKNAEAARNYIKQALEKKNDYAEGYYLSTQLEAADNNIPAAIKSAESLALLAPNNPGVLFQLGLLKYTIQNWAGARDAMALALRISPEYANAKYFYGLAQAKLGEKEEALRVFKELLVANPGVIELNKIIANLEAGKDALLGIGEPAGRANPPITNTASTKPVQ